MPAGYARRVRSRSYRPAYKWFYDHVHSRYYDGMMKWFMLPFGGEGRFREVMFAAVDIAAGARVLDMTCGTGTVTLQCAAAVGSAGLVVGADLSIGQLRRARRKNTYAHLHLVEADATAGPWRDQAFDTVIVPHAIHEMPRAVRTTVLREARRVVKPGGAVYVLELDTPASPVRRFFLGLWLGYWVPDAINFENATRRDMVRHGVDVELREAGFTDVTKHSKCDGTMQVVVGKT